MTQSPICLSIVPPNLTITPSATAKKSLSSLCTSSGSRSLASWVKPDRSANRPVTGRNSPSGECVSGTGASADPQFPQKRELAGFCVPQARQASTSAAPHEVQKRCPSLAGAPQAEQSMVCPANDWSPSLSRRVGDIATAFAVQGSLG